MHKEIGSPDWHADLWREKFCSAVEECDFNKVRDYRKLVFEHTVEVVRNQCYTSSDGDVVKILWDEELIQGTRMYRDELPLVQSKASHETEFGVYRGDCLKAAQILSSEHQDTVVLNMANRQNPGGGVIGGAGAQEEYIFRCSNYFISLYQYVEYGIQYGTSQSGEFRYPMDRNHGGCYSNGVTIFRGLEEDGYPLLKSPWKTNFIAVAALNRPELTIDQDGQEKIVDKLVPAVKSKIRTVLRIALEQDMRVLVLGALGCGAFRNPPGHVAVLFQEVFNEDEFRGQFKKVIFAIKEDHNSRGSGNVSPFIEVFNEVFLQNKMME